MDNAVVPSDNIQEQHRPFVEPEIGQWYWIKEKDLPSENVMEGFPDPQYNWFAVVYEIGSNYVEFRSPGLHNSESYERIHFNDLEDKVLYEPDPKKIIQQNCQVYNDKIQNKLKEIQNISQSLGVAPQTTIDRAPSSEAGLVPVSSTINVQSYKKDLIEAKDKKLPALFEGVKEDQRHLQRCMCMEAMGMKAMVNSLTSVVDSVKKRIFHVTLYAGLTEEIELIRDGVPGRVDEQVHLMQRRLYMDEECLVNYDAGGMEFHDISEFDNWLARDENLKRCLPYSKCIVTFQVRRTAKARNWIGNTAMDMFIRIQLEDLDRATFMYIRNGEKLYRMCTDIDFGEFIFPNLTDFDPQSPKMIRDDGSTINDIMTVKDWEYRRDEEIQRRADYDKWFEDNPYEKWLKDTNREGEGESARWFYQHANPFERYSSAFRFERWEPLNKENVYYDDAMKCLNDKMEEYNRIALIVQGLLDRSEVLQPLPITNLRDQQTFNERVKLIYDGHFTLYAGEKPSVENYIKKCNESINKDSVFIGQELFWMKKEAVKENERIDRSMYNRGRSDHETFKPFLNPGPGFIARGAKLHPRVKAVTFEWLREITNWHNPNCGHKTITRVKVPFSELFNVSAYKPGDYKQFFQDPRTREEYLKWAPMLLAAEDYHAGLKHQTDGGE